MRSDFCKNVAANDMTSAATMEQATGVGPASKAWEAFILPMNYACIALSIADDGRKFKVFSVEPGKMCNRSGMGRQGQNGKSG